MLGQDASDAAADPTPAMSAVADASKAGNVQDGLALPSACVLLALRHGAVPGVGLSEFLDNLIRPQRFAQLPWQLQHMLLTGLPEVLASLPAQRSAAVASTLCTLVSNSNLNAANELSTAAWVGLARYLQSTSAGNSNSGAQAAAMTQAVHEAVQQQDLEAALKAALQEQDSQHQKLATLSTSADKDLVYIKWGAAIICLMAIPVEKVRCRCSYKRSCPG